MNGYSMNLDTYEQKRLISLINKCSTFDMFDYDKSSIDVYGCSFFDNYLYVVAKCYSCIPVVTMGYLWDGNDDVIKLDGTRDCIFDNLHKLGLNVDADNIADYLKFVLGIVCTEEGSLRLVQSIHDVEFSDTPSEEQFAFLENNIKPVSTTRDSDGYTVEANVIYSDSLYLAKMKMKEDGFFDIVSETLLCDGYSCLKQIMLL